MQKARDLSTLEGYSGYGAEQGEKVSQEMTFLLSENTTFDTQYFTG